jgi:hypothetical protein
LLDGQWIDVKRAQPADALPPPKYPRTRAEETMEQVQPKKAEKKPRAAPKRVAPAAPGQDMATQLAMFNWLSMQQQQMWASSYAATPFGYPPAFNADISALLATIGTPVAPKPAKAAEKPEKEPLQAKTGVFGDLSNVLETALASPAKSPSKSPTRRADIDTENNSAPILPVVA